jgi:hypothetical protein
VSAPEILSTHGDAVQKSLKGTAPLPQAQSPGAKESAIASVNGSQESERSGRTEGETSHESTHASVTEKLTLRGSKYTCIQQDEVLREGSTAPKYVSSPLTNKAVADDAFLGVSRSHPAESLVVVTH